MATISFEIDDQELWSTIFGSSPFSFGRGEWFPEAEFLGDADWETVGQIKIVGIDDDENKIEKILGIQDLVDALPTANKQVYMDLFNLDKYDSICADAVLQVAMFGKVIYG
jgi:hypothetical protein